MVNGGRFMNKIHFTLEKTLNELNITKNKLAVESKIRPNTIVAMANNKSKSINLDTLTAVLDALNELAAQQGINRTFNIEDVFIYKR
jgi:DNA-binding Xre family transcriptional regulator